MKGCTKEDDNGVSNQIRGPFEIYVLCNKLCTGLGNALVDKGSQVSLVKESGLTDDRTLGVSFHVLKA